MNKRKLLLTLGILGSLGAAGVGHYLWQKNKTDENADARRDLQRYRRITKKMENYYKRETGEVEPESYPDFIENQNHEIEFSEAIRSDIVRDPEDTKYIMEELAKDENEGTFPVVPAVYSPKNFKVGTGNKKLEGQVEFTINAIHPQHKPLLQQTSAKTNAHVLIDNKYHDLLYMPEAKVSFYFPEGYFENIKKKHNMDPEVGALIWGIKIADRYLDELYSSKHPATKIYPAEIDKYEEELRRARAYIRHALNNFSTGHHMIRSAMLRAEKEYSREGKISGLLNKSHYLVFLPRGEDSHFGTVSLHHIPLFNKHLKKIIEEYHLLRDQLKWEF